MAEKSHLQPRGKGGGRPRTQFHPNQPFLPVHPALSYEKNDPGGKNADEAGWLDVQWQSDLAPETCWFCS